MARRLSIIRTAASFITGSAVGWMAHDCLSSTTVGVSSPWDDNWDRRDPKSLVRPNKKLSAKNCNVSIAMEEEIKKKTPKASRHIFLIRHGQYNEEGVTDEMKILTLLGNEQADMTGQRLQELNHPYMIIVHSSMKRAVQTASIIHKHLSAIPMVQSDLICEGAPCPPEPPSRNWRPEYKFFQDGARIEAAFLQYFHRADPNQSQDSYEIMVCHANVIRYFVCRALQIPSEAWLRMSLSHGSITWITIRPSGRVGLRCLGDVGHMPQDKITLV